MDKRLAFIGGGNIAQAILSGLIPTFEDPRTIIVADPSDAQGLQCKACLLYTSPSPRDS